MTEGTAVGQRALSFEGTWPPVTTWRGFTLSISEALYVFWVMSAPLLSLITWLELGIVFLMLLGVRGILLQRWLIDPVGDPTTSTKDVWRERYAPITYFFHRNYGLHASAAYALMGADKLGAFVLLAIGAGVDMKREKRVRLGRYLEASEPKRSLRSALERVIFPKNPLIGALASLSACIIFLEIIWEIGSPSHFLITLLDTYSSLMAHFQSAIGIHPLAGSNFSNIDDIFRYRATISLYVIVSFWFCVPYTSRLIWSYVAIEGRIPFFIPSTILSTAFISFSLFVVYQIFISSSLILGNLLNDGVQLKGYWNFTFTRAAVLLFSQVLVAIHLSGYFTVLTRFRAGDQTPKW